MQVKDIMTQDAYICYETDTVENAMAYMAKKKTSGLPIVDSEMHVVGFISDGDMMGFISRKRPILLDFYDHTSVIYDEVSFKEKLESLMKKNVMELATTRVVTVDAEDYVDEAAEILAKKKIKKLPVVDENGKLVGVISRSTIVRRIMSDMIETFEGGKNE